MSDARVEAFNDGVAEVVPDPANIAAVAAVVGLVNEVIVAGNKLALLESVLSGSVIEAFPVPKDFERSPDEADGNSMERSGLTTGTIGKEVVGDVVVDDAGVVLFEEFNDIMLFINF